MLHHVGCSALKNWLSHYHFVPISVLTEPCADETALAILALCCHKTPNNNFYPVTTLQFCPWEFSCSMAYHILRRWDTGWTQTCIPQESQNTRVPERKSWESLCCSLDTCDMVRGHIYSVEAIMEGVSISASQTEADLYLLDKCY